MRVTILGIRRCRARNLGDGLIIPTPVHDRSVPVRLNVPLLRKAARHEESDREVKALLAKLEATEALRSDTRHSLGDRMAYNPLGQFGCALTR